MKKLLFLLISIPLIFSSCEQEDNTPETSPPPNPIHGSWNLDSGVYYLVQGIIDQNNQEIVLELIGIDYLKNKDDYEINLMFNNNAHISLKTETIEVRLEDQNEIE